ncbi:thymidylate kinase [Auriculariales sp. MPI-PUGE-AT-0066]|nr:thymidylate kinase [Auriculariales sp. MPI-PUGE-AT-0066]
MSDSTATESLSQPTNRGAFIVIEGMDRAGKTTQAALLRDRLTAAGRPVELIKFPDRTTAIGKMIDAYLRSATDLDDRAIHLLFSANRWECASRIQTALRAGTTLVCDRYAFSGIAFSAAKLAFAAYAGGFAWCATPDDGLPAPDLVLFLDVSPEVAAARGGYGLERYEREEVQRAVRKVFARIGDVDRLVDDQARSVIGRARNWHVVDAGKSVEEVADDMWKTVDAAKLTEGTSEPLLRLWDYASLA